MAGDKDGATFGCERREPVNTFGVETVHGFVEDEDGRVPEESGGDAEPLALLRKCVALGGQSGSVSLRGCATRDLKGVRPGRHPSALPNDPRNPGTGRRHGFHASAIDVVRVVVTTMALGVVHGARRAASGSRRADNHGEAPSPRTSQRGATMCRRSGGRVTLVAAAAIALAACSGSDSPNAASSTTITGRGTSTSRGNDGRSVTTMRGGAQAVDPSYFANGSCVRFQPTSGNGHITVFLDAGHGGIDPGAVGTTESGKTIYEGDITLPVELDTMAVLRAKGFTVVVSRTRNTTVLRLRPGDLNGNVFSLVGAHNEIAARDICANDAHANLLVGIYFDASSSPLGAGCVTTYDAVRPFSKENLRVAQLLQSSVVPAMNRRGWQIPNAGVRDDVGMGSNNGNPATSALAAMALEYDHLMVLGPAMKGYFSTPSEMPGALIEPLFITDPFEASIAVNPKDQHVIASGIAHAVEEYFLSGT